MKKMLTVFRHFLYFFKRYNQPIFFIYHPTLLLLQGKMFSCCDSSSVENSIIDKIQPCRLHRKPILFVCLNNQTCADKALFCTDCADIHKGHKWETVQKYFTPEVKKLLEPDRTMMKSNDEEAVEEMLEEVAKFKARLQYKLIEFQNQVEADYENLQKKVSSASDDPIGISEVNNQTMSQIIKLIDKEKKKSYIKELKQETQSALKLTEENINFTLDSLKQTIARSDWQNLKKQERQKMFTTFSSRFRPLETKKEKPSFRFSKADKSAGVDVSDNCIEVYYKNQAILKPAVACTVSFTPFYNKIGFKVTKLDKMVIFFEKSIVYLGVCIAQIALSYKFMNLTAPSRGSYFIGSNGLSYHSKLPEYDKKNSGIQFSVGDVIEMWVDFKEGSLNFKKQKGILNTTFSMKLGLNKKFMHKLTPCVMFSGEEGPKVKLLTEQDLEKEQK